MTRPSRRGNSVREGTGGELAGGRWEVQRAESGGAGRVQDGSELCGQGHRPWMVLSSQPEEFGLYLYLMKTI